MYPCVEEEKCPGSDPREVSSDIGWDAKIFILMAHLIRVGADCLNLNHVSANQCVARLTLARRQRNL
jgi:hypothetical protein